MVGLVNVLGMGTGGMLAACSLSVMAVSSSSLWGDSLELVVGMLITLIGGGDFFGVVQLVSVLGEWVGGMLAAWLLSSSRQWGDILVGVVGMLISLSGGGYFLGLVGFVTVLGNGVRGLLAACLLTAMTVSSSSLWGDSLKGVVDLLTMLIRGGDFFGVVGVVSVLGNWVGGMLAVCVLLVVAVTLSSLWGHILRLVVGMLITFVWWGGFFGVVGVVSMLGSWVGSMLAACPLSAVLVTSSVCLSHRLPSWSVGMPSIWSGVPVFGISIRLLLTISISRTSTYLRQSPGIVGDCLANVV